VGVFLSFTLSQAGMARHWWHIRNNANSGWQWKIFINLTGAVCTAVVTLIFAATKFVDGAWIIVLLLPALVACFYLIHRHYQTVSGNLSLDDYGQPVSSRRHRILVPVAGIHRGTLQAIDYALSISPDVTAVHISTDASQTEQVQQKWNKWGNGVRLVVIESPYRAFLEPFLDYVDGIHSVLQPNERMTIIVPQFVPERWWHNILHEQTAFWLRFALLSKKGIVVSEVPYLID
jgi:hypothetical protein